MKIENIIEKIDDVFFIIAPHFLYRLVHTIFDINGHINALKRFAQRIVRGWDDSETWELDTCFYVWIKPRLKRLRELTHCYPGTERYPTFESWVNELDYRCWQLDNIIKYTYKSYDFPYHDYITDAQIKNTNPKFTELDHYKSDLALEASKKDFMIWFSDNINHLWW